MTSNSLWASYPRQHLMQDASAFPALQPIGSRHGFRISLPVHNMIDDLTPAAAGSRKQMHVWSHGSGSPFPCRSSALHLHATKHTKISLRLFVCACFESPNISECHFGHLIPHGTFSFSTCSNSKLSYCDDSLQQFSLPRQSQFPLAR